jgi:hypothetical protein
MDSGFRRNDVLLAGRGFLALYIMRPGSHHPEGRWTFISISRKLATSNSIK